MLRAPSPTVRLQLAVVVAGLALVTVTFRATDLDLAAAAVFHQGCCSWPMAERPLWRFVYGWGVFGGLLLAAGALVTLTLSYWYPARLHAWRRPALFLVVVVALGPGLVVNAALKDHWGRPRPRDVVELGGPEPFLPVLTPGPDPQARSFPCGHCSMGFYLATPWLVLRRRRPRLALAFAAGGAGWGLVMGAARMMAGGHFLSDVLWSGGLVWLVALAVHHALDLDRLPGPAPVTDPYRDRARARAATALGGGALALLTGGVLLATPYVSAKRFVRSAAQVAASPAAAWEVLLDEATVSISAGEGLEASYEVRAFGFPTSRMAFRLLEEPEVAVLSIERMGWFTERRTTVAVRLPRDGARPVRVRLGKGRLDLDLRGFSPAARLEVEVGEGDVRVSGAGALPPGAVSLRVEHGRVTRE